MRVSFDKFNFLITTTMKKVIITLSIAALCLCSCGNNNNSKKAEGEAAATEQCCEENAEGECAKCKEEGKSCEGCTQHDTTVVAETPAAE